MVTAPPSSVSTEPPEDAAHQPGVWLFVLMAAGSALLLGFIFAKSPVAVPALAGGAGFLWLCFARPSWSIYAFLFCLVAVPVYLRLPPIGPLPPPPIAITMLLSLAGVAILVRLMTGGQRLWGRGGRALFGAYAVWGLVMLTSLIDERTSAEGVNMWFKAVVFPIVVILILSNGLRGQRQVDSAYKALLAAAVAISIYAVWEYSNGQNWLMDTFLPEGGKEWSSDEFTALALAGESYRAFSVFTQPIEFGTCVGMIYLYALVQVGLAKSNWHRLAFAILAIACLAGIAASFSRMPMASALFGALLVSIIIKPLRKWLAAGIAAGAMVLLTAWPWIGAMIASRLRDIDNFTIRVKFWEAAAAIFSEHPLRGVGIGNYPQYHLEAIRDHQIGPFAEFSGSGLDRATVAESTYYQLAAEGGLLGLTTYAVMMYMFFALVVKGLRASVSDRQMGLYAAIGLGGVNYMTNSLTITAYTHFTSTMLMLGVLFAFVIVLDREAGGTDRVSRSVPQSLAE
jgi:O-Antigen ligase